MLIRIALFISLIALFYNYCKEDFSADYYRGPNDLNFIEVPVDIYPTSIYKSNPEASIQKDSSSVSSHHTNFKFESGLISSVSQKY